MLDRKRGFGSARLVTGGFGKSASSGDGAASKALAIFWLLLNDYHPRDFTISFWDGSQWPAENGSPRFTLRVRSPAALRRMLMTGSSDLSLSESYISGELDVTGDFEAAMPLASYLMNRRWRAGARLRLAAILLQLPRGNRLLRWDRKQAELSGEQHSIQRDRQAVTYHYDVSNQFYAVWLDGSMVYSCAYFETDDDCLDTAQARKLDYLCRKLRLRPGERLLDIGCGWGALLIHAVRKYGVQALGITLSENQAKFAHDRIAKAGLQNQSVMIRTFGLIELLTACSSRGPRLAQAAEALQKGRRSGIGARGDVSGEGRHTSIQLIHLIVSMISSLACMK